MSASILFLMLALQGPIARGQVVPPADIVIPPRPTEEEMNRAKAKIAEFLRNNRQDQPAKSSGDPILDDVLNVIRRQGSVLDGSALDANREDQAPGSLPRSIDAATDHRGAGPVQESDAVYVAAEHLLRAARSLQRLPVQDNGSDELVRAMRRQAAILMIDAISQESLMQGAAL